MAAIKTAYGSSSNLTITLASLASSTSRLAGQESTEVSNTTDLNLDYLLSGKVTTGTSPTASRTIEVCVVGLMDDTTYPDVFDGTNSAETVTSAEIKGAICRIAAAMPTTSTSNVTYHFGPVSVANLFGGVLPKRFVVFVTHDTGVALNSTAGNHQITVTPVWATSA